MRIPVLFLMSLLFGSLGIASGVGASSIPKPVPVEIHWDKGYQTIEGFGASNAFNLESGAVSPEQAELFFSSDKGVGLSLLRVQVPYNGACLPGPNGVSPADPVACAGGINTVTDMIAAKSYGVRVWATPWSPPKEFKTNGSPVGGSIKGTSFAGYATYLTRYFESVKSTSGNDLYALSVQNEPNSHVSFASANWDWKKVSSFISNSLGPALRGSNIRIMMPETSAYNVMNSYIKHGIPDQVSILAFHDYDGGMPKGNPVPNKSFWQTEICGLHSFSGPLKGAWDPSIRDAISWASHLHAMLVTANVNAWNWWWLLSRSSSPANKRNQSLINLEGEVAQRLYTIGNFSKFVRPGFVRIDATSVPQQNVLVSAYKNPRSHDFAIVAINKGPAAVSQKFNLSLGFQTSKLVPWQTSDGVPLVSQPSVTLDHPQTGSSGDPDHTFIYSLPGMSVTTFVCKDC